MRANFIVALLLLLMTSSRGDVSCKFWHVTDMHYDMYYDATAQDKSQVCPSSYGDAAIDPGQFGDYKCDAPWGLIDSAVENMKNFHPDADFIIWTGDDTLHTGNEEQDLSEDLVVEIITKQTQLLRNYFPDTPIFPTMGNHDFHLKNQMPIGESYILSKVAEIWCPLITEDSDVDGEMCDFFNKTGSYYRFLPNNSKIMLISINTLVWYKSNKQVDGTGDPNNQFQWIEELLQRARLEGFKTYLIGHIPPGYFELVSDVYWLYEEYNARYLRLLSEYYDVVAGQFFGHHHTDSYRMFYDGGDEGKPVSVMWLAPGVTPWMTTLPGVVNGANNPGIRIFEYDPQSGEQMDYVQYYLDLAEANQGNLEWRIEYRATEAFDATDLSALSMSRFTTKLRDSELTSALVQNFVFHNSVSYDEKYCDEDCRLYHVCAVDCVDHQAHNDCIKRGAGGAGSTLDRAGFFHLVAVALIFAFLS